MFLIIGDLHFQSNNGKTTDILHKETIVVEGKNRVVDLMSEISEGKLKSKFIDILFCQGIE